jgi:phenylacetate-CoA ligase
MHAAPEMIHEAQQRSRLEELLPGWREVPLYRDLLAGGSMPDLEWFYRLPFLGKAAMRENFPRNFLGEPAMLETLLAQGLVELEHTSGTTSERLPVVFATGWWNAQEERALRLNARVAAILDAYPHARRVTITSPSCNGLTCPTAWMSREQRIIGSALFVNLQRIPFVLPDAERARMVEETAGWEPVFLDADPVHAVWFALDCERRGIKFPSLQFILGSYEFVSVVHKKIIARVFGVPLFNLYGSTETGHLLMENARGEMQPSLETAFLEIVQPDARGVGDLVVTTLSNDYMPLLRYRIGDLAEKISSPAGARYVVHGRIRDALLAADGTRVTTWMVDQCFADADGIAHYELRQHEDGRCELRYIPDAQPPAEKTLAAVTARLEALLQTREKIPATAMATLVPAASGKFRLTCRVTPDTVTA